MDTFLIGLSIGATLAIVGDHFWTKHLTKVEARIKADVVAAEALTQPTFNIPGQVWKDI